MSNEHLIDGQNQQKGFTLFKFKRMGRAYYFVWLCIYWLIAFFVFPFVFVFFMFGALSYAQAPQNTLFALFIFFLPFILFYLPLMILHIKRMHDCDMSAKGEICFCLISLSIPFFGFMFSPIFLFRFPSLIFLASLFLVFIPGTKGPNKYGNPPSDC